MRDRQQDFLQELNKVLKEEQIQLQEPMSRHTTFRVGGPADIYVLPQINQVKEVLQLCSTFDIPICIKGNGSNLLVGDKGIRGVVLELGKNAADISVAGNHITAEAGAILGAVAKKALEQSLTGLESAAGIPGTVGGAVVMNAGAYGWEMKDSLVKATVLTRELEVKELTSEELELSYRHSNVLDNGYVVLKAEFALTPGNQEEIQEAMEDYRQRRQDKQPLNYPSAGSTFKRPEGNFAGKLIQDAGLRGFQVGGAQVSEKHCGFVVNKENATAADIMSLISQVQEKVRDQFGVTLEPEVKRMGEF